MLRRICDAIDGFSVFLGHASGMFYFACIAISAFEVVLRYGFNSPTIWSAELTMVLCSSAWILSVGYITERRRHISITMLEMLVSRAVWHWLRLAQILIALGAVSVLAWAAWRPAAKALQRAEYSGTALNSLEPSVFKVLLVIGCLLYILQLLSNLVRWVQATERDGYDGH